MVNLRKLKLKMRLDKDLRHALVRGQRNELLIDLDGDKLPDIALLDTTGDGNIDTMALDLDESGDFSVCLCDTDGNGVPDTILALDAETGKPVPVAYGSAVEDELLADAQAVADAVALGDYVAANLDDALDRLERGIRRSRKALGRR